MDIAFAKEKNKNKKTFLERFSFLKNKESLFYYYMFMVVIGVFFFCSSLFTNSFTTPFTGDYVSQQYSFYTNGYDDWWHFLKTGKFILYDTNTYLGVSNIGSNSFYYLFDPFFLPILLCPRQLIPQGIAILTIFKISTAGLMFYFYMRYIGASKWSAKISGLAYAFSGWMAWYLWFNHMTEITIVFPLMLLGVERVLKTKKPWMLAFSIFLMGITNFFFLVCCTFAAFFYALFRYFQHVKDRTIKDNFEVLGLGFLGFAIGLMMSCIVVIPAALVSLNAPRAQNKEYLGILSECLENLGDKTYRKQLWNIVSSWENLTVRSYQIKERNFFPLLEYIFPAMTCREVPIVDYSHSYDNVAGSIFCYYPIIILFTPALIKSCREKHFSPLIATGLFIFALFTPFAYYLFHGFTDEPYSRWTLFAETSLIAYVGLYLDKFKKDDKWTLVVGVVTTELLILLGCVLAHKLTLIENDMFSEYVPIKLVGTLASIYVLIVGTVLYIFKNKKFIHFLFVGFISFEAIAMGAFVIEGHGVQNYQQTNNGLDNNNALHSLVKQISKNDPSYYRCYSSQENTSARNDGMRNNYNGLGFFHSVYNYNIANFCNWSCMTDGKAPDSWSGSYVEKRMNLDTFLGVKYYFVRKDTVPYKDKNAPEYRCNVPLNFVDITDQYPNDFYFIFENKNFIDFAFSFDNAYSYNTAEEVDKNLKTNDVLFNEELYFDGAISDYETVDKMIELSDGDVSLKEVGSFIQDSHSLYLHSDLTPSTTRYVKTFYNCTNFKPSYKMTSDELLNIDSNDNIIKSMSTDTKEGKNDKYVTVINFPTNTNYSYDYDPDGNMFYLKNYLTWDYRVNVYFIDEDNHFVTYDDHNDQQMSVSNYTGRKNWRGYYIAPTYDSNGNKIKDAPRITKMIIVNKGCKVMTYSLNYDTMTNYKNRVQKFFDNPITDIKYDTNKFTFKTNFDKKRIVVTQIPYEDGWKVVARDNVGKENNIDVFMSQGGFVSFVSNKNYAEYEMIYFTPYLQLGSYISVAGLTLFLTSFIAYYYISNKLNEVELVCDEHYKRKNAKTIQKLKI